MNVYDMPINFPSYQALNVGDIFIWYVGKNDKIDENGNPLIHGHWFEVRFKNKRYAEIDVTMLRCDYFVETKGKFVPKCDCGGFEKGNTYTIGFSKLQEWQGKTRWLRSPGAKVLFSQRSV